MKLRKGDKVKIISGKDKGKEGSVDRVLLKEGKVLVLGVNVVKKHLKKSQNQKGGIVEQTKPIPVCRAMLICPKCSKPARVGIYLDKNKKYRKCKKCGEVF